MSPVGEAGMAASAWQSASGATDVRFGGAVGVACRVTQSGRRAPTHGDFYSRPSFGGLYSAVNR